VWREATNKLVCVIDRALAKAIGCALCIAAVSDLVVAVAANGGRVLILRLVDGDAAPATPVDALEQGAASTDARKRIVMARASTCCALLRTPGFVAMLWACCVRVLCSPCGAVVATLHGNTAGGRQSSHPRRLMPLPATDHDIAQRWHSVHVVTVAVLVGPC
jgi:hypothetical protein